MSTNKLSEYLYARPSFREGVARLMDVSGSLSVYNSALTLRYNSVLTPTEADNLALLSDWVVVGDDIKEAITVFKRQNDSSELIKGIRREDLLKD